MRSFKAGLFLEKKNTALFFINDTAKEQNFGW
jgi:hypothetical protein